VRYRGNRPALKLGESQKHIFDRGRGEKGKKGKTSAETLRQKFSIHASAGERLMITRGRKTWIRKEGSKCGGEGRGKKGGRAQSAPLSLIERSAKKRQRGERPSDSRRKKRKGGGPTWSQGEPRRQKKKKNCSLSFLRRKAPRCYQRTEEKERYGTARKREKKPSTKHVTRSDQEGKKTTGTLRPAD